MDGFILVAGGTGRIGTPLVRALRKRGHRVRALTRDPQAPPARELAAVGADPVAGDFDDPASLIAAARGADAVFAAGTAHRAGPEGEARHGANIAQAAQSASVPHLVYASGAGADGPTGVPVLESKRSVEEAIRSLGVRHTILAPVYFMENAFNPWNLPALGEHRLALPLPREFPLQQLAIADLVSVAVAVLEDPDAYADQRIELASDEPTGAEMTEALARVTGNPYAFEGVPHERLAPPMGRLFAWIEGGGQHVDIAGLRERFPANGWHAFEAWATEQRWP